MQTLTINLLNGNPMTFRPVPMVRMASQTPSDWLAFQRQHAYGTEMTESERNRVIKFMHEHKTEALSDGTNIYTLAGSLLAHCDPTAIK